MRLPIQALKEIGNKYGYSVVVVYAFDDSKARQHIASWGKTIILCDQAAQWADKLKDALGWPESLHAMPNRVKKLQNQRDALRAENEKLKTAAKGLIEALPEIAFELGIGWTNLGTIKRRRKEMIQALKEVAK